MSPRPPLVERLASHPLLAAMEPAVLVELARAGVRRRLHPGAVLFSHGQRSPKLAFILSGRIDIRSTSPSGQSSVLRSLGPNQLVGVSIAFGALPSADVIAAEETAVVLFPRSALERTLLRSPQACFAAVLHMAQIVSDLTEEIDELRIHDLRLRVLRRLRRLGRGRRELAITHAELAAQVGATRANVSRALQRLEAQGHIERHRGRITLCSRT
ncbi:MAG: Crp/Fnr family transcriptional regulator [Myxococcales bacterium]|nr:Crp/Fnr family transcriptional regulator [Myxococcales bacterium]